MSGECEIIVGTYEQFLLGYRIEQTENEYKLERSFATHSHQASIRAVNGKRRYLASAGADDSVCLYDMRYRVESGRLNHHTDTVNCVTFTPDASHILTCGNDGSIAVLRCGNWQLEKHWRGSHNGAPVNALAVHPTGKIALSIGGDGALRTWNLVKGRQAYATNLVPRLKQDAKNISVLAWSPNGEKYLLGVNFVVDVYSVETAGIVNEMKFDSKVICVEFLKNNLIIIGHEDGKVRIYDLKRSENILEEAAHNGRVKCVQRRSGRLVTASSSGEIKLWRYAKRKLELLAAVNCGARITCLSLVLPPEDLPVKEEEVKEEEKVESREINGFRTKREVIVELEDDGDQVTIENSARKSELEVERGVQGTGDGRKRAKKKEKKETAIVRTDRLEKTKTKKKSKLESGKASSSVVRALGNTKGQHSEGKPRRKSKAATSRMAETAASAKRGKESDEVPPKKKKKKLVR